jgi:predicted TIM-barrel fold metal-dependent hydrolase
MQEAIDAHVHVWTDDRKRYPRTTGESESKPDRFTVEDYFSHAKSLDITRAVLIQMSFYGFDNSYMLDTMHAHPGKFSGVAIVDSASAHPERAMEDLAKQGVRGFRISPGNSPDTWLDTPGMQTMWRIGAKRKLAMCPLVNPKDLVSIDRMCAKNPDTPVVIDHLARIGADGEVRDADIRLLSGLSKHRNVNVKVSAFYALGRKAAPYKDLTPLIKRVFEDFGPRRLMWASDCPFQVQDGHTLAGSISLIRDGLPFLSNEDREWLLAKTADSVFFRQLS